eukprot:1219980-Pleurochrysis_carterae.AAC.1
MPPLSFFLGGHALPLVISFDATGFGSQQVNTIVLNNPDDRSGKSRLLGDNLAVINNRLAEERMGTLAEYTVNGLLVKANTKIYIVLDVSAFGTPSICPTQAGAPAFATTRCARC